jgi:DHA1 family tetracycline resistance protein-like MFS transporter
MSRDSEKKHGFSLFSIFFTFFIDTLGVTIVFPIFAPLFLNPHETILPAFFSYNVKASILGVFLAAYPLSQLIFSPIIGEFADRCGRKKALLITTILTCIGYLLCAFSIDHKWIFLLFFSRLIMGASAGNLSLCLSAIADLSPTKKDRVKYYGLGSMLAGLTFVVGPFIGGKLSDVTLHPWFNLSFPLSVGAFFAGVNVLFLLFAFVETFCVKASQSFDFIKGLHNIQMAFKMPSVRRLYLMYFFYLLSWNMLFQLIPAFLVTKFSARSSLIGDISALMGLSWVIGSVILYKGFLPYFRSKTLLIVEALLFALAVFACAYLKNMWFFSAVLGFSVLIASFGWPLCTGIISNAVESQMQGKILALSQSIQSLAMMLAPIIVGPFLSKQSGVPFFIAAGFSLVFGILVTTTKFQEHFHRD